MKIGIKQIVFTKPNTAELLDMGEVDLDRFTDDQVAVKTVYSTISCGTERSNITGQRNLGTTDAGMCFPAYPGYNSAGVVVATGKNVTSVKAGDRVVVYWGCHKNYNIMPEDRVVKIEDDKIGFSTAAISFISTFPLAAIRKVNLEIGESALVMGLGILGQIAVQYARIAGAAPVIAVDPVKERREKALQNGADYAFDPTEEGFAEKVKAVTGGGVNTAIEVTGLGVGLNQALDCMAKFGRVALLGCTRDSNFTVDYYRKIHGTGVTLVGAHTNARPEKESHHSYYTHRDDIRAALRLCSYGRLDLGDMIEETHSPQDCAKVYARLINDRNFPICVQFHWNLL